MFTRKQIENYRNKCESMLLDKRNWRPIDFTKDWKKWIDSIVPVPAVYVLIANGGKIVYVGQTDDMQRRMKELRGENRHTLRRHIGIRYIESKLKLSYLEIRLGRLEIEKFIIDQHHPEFNNKRETQK